MIIVRVHVYLLRKKSESINFMKTFLSYVETQFDTLIKMVKIDNAKELCEGEMLNLSK